jgi:zeaxanthin glucosyltransferase
LLVEEAHYTEAGYNHDLPQHRSWSAGVPSLKPIVFCSLGSQVSRFPQARIFFDRIIAAAEALPDYYFVLNSAYLSVRPAGAENISVLPFVRNADILPRASAAIIHGGFGTIKECIYFQVPALICPQQWDQPMNAVRVQDHGLGLAISVDDLTPDRVAQALGHIMTCSQIKANLRRMRQLFLDTEARELTANVCEALISA